jgi:hypothetical protein
MSIEEMPARDSRRRMCWRVRMSWCNAVEYSRAAYQFDFQG